MSSPRKPRRGRPAAVDPSATRRRILDAARVVFADEGYSASLATIARRAGVTAPAISHHYGNKMELFRAVAQDVDDTLLAEFERAVSRRDTFMGRLQAMVDAAVAAHRADPSMTSFLSLAQLEFTRMDGTAARPAAEQGGVVALLWRIVTEAGDAGELPGESDPAAVVALLLAVTLGVAFYAAIIDPAATDSLFSEWRRLVAGRLLPCPDAGT